MQQSTIRCRELLTVFWATYFKSFKTFRIYIQYVQYVGNAPPPHSLVVKLFDGAKAEIDFVLDKFFTAGDESNVEQVPITKCSSKK
jgi:hypothetical protein